MSLRGKNYPGWLASGTEYGIVKFLDFCKENFRRKNHECNERFQYISDHPTSSIGSSDGTGKHRRIAGAVCGSPTLPPHRNESSRRYDDWNQQATHRLGCLCHTIRRKQRTIAGSGRGIEKDGGLAQRQSPQCR